MFRPNNTLEKQLTVIRKLVKVAEDFAEHIAGISPGSQHHAEVEDTIADGEYLLKQMGGVAARTAPAPSMAASGQCQAA